MKYKHLDQHDRNQIEILLNKQYNQKDIALVLKVNKSTISREITKYKCIDGVYRAKEAHHKEMIQRSNSKYQGMKIEKDTQLKEKIVYALDQYQSPRAIALRLEGISHMSIYKWLYSPFGQQYCIHLCSKRYRKKKQRKKSFGREMIPGAISVHKRPEIGIHLEGDLFVSSHNTVLVAVLTEPKSQYVWAVKIPNRRPSTMRDVINDLIIDMSIDSITWDRGIENKYHQELSTSSYFCDPHSPWQKPHVENNIGLLRKWFVPKGTDLNCMKQTDLDRYISIINDKWRVSRNGKSARELIEEFGIIK